MYNSVKHLFYNTYGTSDAQFSSELHPYKSDYDKNPMFVFGSETGIYNPNSIYSDTTENLVVEQKKDIG